MMLFPQVYLLSGFAYGLHQNCYGIDLPEQNRLVLIDTGLDSTDLIISAHTLRLFGLAERTISHVFLTHAHFDHSGNASFYQSGGAKILIGKADADAVKKGLNGTIAYAYAEPFPACSTVTPLEDGFTLNLSQHATLLCHHVPGHTDGCMLYQLKLHGADLLFTGDYIQSSLNGQDAILGIMVDETYSYDNYKASLKKTLSLPCDLLLPGHFQPCLYKGYQLLQKGYRELLTGRNKYR